jgi:hypothetical protein
MDNQMWENTATAENVAALRKRGVIFVGPAEGRLASGRMGRGRLVETEQVIGAVRQAIGAHGDLAGKRIVVSAGGTQEPIDPVRYIGNRSSGKMGFAIAGGARPRRGGDADVRRSLATPYGVDRVDVHATAGGRGGVAPPMAAPRSSWRRRRRTSGRRRRRTESSARARHRRRTGANPDIIGGLRAFVSRVCGGDRRVPSRARGSRRRGSTSSPRTAARPRSLPPHQRDADLGRLPSKSCRCSRSTRSHTASSTAWPTSSGSAAGSAAGTGLRTLEVVPRDARDVGLHGPASPSSRCPT